MILRSFRAFLPAMLTAFLLARSEVRPETASLTPAADTTLFEPNPNNNFGASSSLAAGTTARGLKSRMLIRFDVAANLPAGAQIANVSLRVQVTKVPVGPVPSSFTLRRVLVPWGEGTKSGTLGAPATAGESTWTARTAPSTLWTEPGGASGSDFAASSSASVQVSGTGAYTFDSTPELVADAQFWLEQPDQNFGWVLGTESEETSLTARRFGSREDAANSPVLTVEYSIKAGLVQITSIVASPPDVVITWSGGSPPFQLQQKTALSEAAWVNAGSAISTNTAAVPMSAPQSFFRVSEAR